MKRKLLVLPLALALLATGVSAHTNGGLLGDIPSTTETVTVDGKKDAIYDYGLAVDINPFYNPYVTYESDGTEKISPAAAECYADRSVGFAYKIDENDLCYKLFTQHGFTWGGNWNNSKDYQHFQKSMP